jgi:CheY-like chemotaxis protein
MGTVLVVDDNVDTCKVLRNFLGRAGHHGLSVTSVTAALDMLHDLSSPLPDVIITDLMMPGASGIDLLRAVAMYPRTSEIPVIVYSAVSEHRYVQQAIDAGAVDYWLKGSIHPNELESRLAAYLPAGVGWAAPLRHDPVHAS